MVREPACRVSFAWPVRIPASMTCLCKSVGSGGRWPFLSHNWRPSVRTNQPRKLRRLALLGFAGLLPLIYARLPKALKHESSISLSRRQGRLPVHFEFTTRRDDVTRSIDRTSLGGIRCD